MPLQSASGLIQVACGEDFSLALSAGGNVYSSGNGKFGVHGCGSDDLGNRYAFVPIGGTQGVDDGFFKQKQIKYITAGESHCGAVDAQGGVYTWGLNQDGQCGVT